MDIKDSVLLSNANGTQYLLRLSTCMAVLRIDKKLFFLSVHNKYDEFIFSDPQSAMVQIANKMCLLFPAQTFTSYDGDQCMFVGNLEFAVCMRTSPGLLTIRFGTTTFSFKKKEEGLEGFQKAVDRLMV